jgi:outer membrane protein, multidrug efflux system
LDVRRAQLEHAITVFVGRLASELPLAKSHFDGTSPAIPPGRPADLLARRPDIAEGERYMVSASARIGCIRRHPNNSFALLGETAKQGSSS